MTEPTVLPPSQQVEVNVRVRKEWNKKEAGIGVGLLESGEVQDLPHVYNARCLIPKGNKGIQVALLNAQNESQILAQDTE